MKCYFSSQFLAQIASHALKNVIEAIWGDRTIIMIAHRLTTVKNCDMIYLMNEGRITDKGTYDELLVHSKEFRKMNLIDENES